MKSYQALLFCAFMALASLVLTEAGSNFGMITSRQGQVRFRPENCTADAEGNCAAFYHVESSGTEPLILYLDKIPSGGRCSVYGSGCGAQTVYMAPIYNETQEGISIPINSRSFSFMITMPSTQRYDSFEVSWTPDLNFSGQDSADEETAYGWTNTEVGSTTWRFSGPENIRILVPPKDGRKVTVETINEAASSGNWWEPTQECICTLTQMYPQGCRSVFTNSYGMTSTYTTVMRGENTVMRLHCTNTGVAVPHPEVTLRWERA